MQTILVVGAGKSSTCLIHYLLTHAARNRWHIIVADESAAAIQLRIQGHRCAESAAVDITQASERKRLVGKADLVISLLPPQLHVLLAMDCLALKKDLITSSYRSPEIIALNEAAEEAGLMFMCEMGLDPGIDHMSASQAIHSIQKVPASIVSFKSFCGGLIAPESDDNPWHYKFTWNPANIIAAGMQGARYRENGNIIILPYERIFEPRPLKEIPHLGRFSWYPNRDSLDYLPLYNLQEIPDFMRATLRMPGFTDGWHALVRLGLTEMNDEFKEPPKTYADWLRQKTACPDTTLLKNHITTLLPDSEQSDVLKMLEWLGLFEDSIIPDPRAESAKILLDLLLKKWEMKPQDQDWVIMHHEIIYLHKRHRVELACTLSVTGTNKLESAIAKTVGLPMAILARLLLTRKLRKPVGVLIPTMPAVYKPVLRELSLNGISFQENVK